jgi:molybdopterin molybdotransferase
LARGTVARIFTGAPVPEGADAVVMQEEVTRDGDIFRLARRPAPGLSIRPAGSDMAAGARALAEGTRLGDRAIAACSAAGADHVDVTRRLRVALLVTGDEVRPTGRARRGTDPGCERPDAARGAVLRPDRPGRHHPRGR